MARIPKGINGPIKGKVGKVVGSSRNDTEYIKSIPKPRTAPFTKGELANQDRFGMQQKWLQPVLPYIRVGFSNFSYRPNKEAFVSAKSYMSTYAMEGKGADTKIVPSKMQVSYGELPNAKNIKLELLDKVETELARKVKFSWENDWDNPEIYGARPDDQAMLLAYDIENSKAQMSVYGPFRMAREETLMLTRPFKLMKRPEIPVVYHCYIAFVSGDRSKQSNSIYLGTVTI